MPDGSLIEPEEMFVLTPDMLERTVPEDVAKARGDFPPEDSLDPPVEVILEEDREPVDEDEGGAGDPPAGEADPGTNQEADPAEVKTTPKDVPYGRFAEKLKEMQALKDKIAELEARQVAPPAAAAPPPPATPPAATETKAEPAANAPPAYDFGGKWKEYSDLVSDGFTEDAAKLMLEIQGEQRKVDRMEIAAALREEARIREEERQRVETEKAAAARVAEIKPLIDRILVDHTDWFSAPGNLNRFDGEKNAFIAEGLSHKEALLAAEKKFFGEKEDPQKKVDDIKTEQQKKTVITGAKAAGQQPASLTGGRGSRQTPQIKPNALLLTEVERKTMTEKERKAARGDYV